MSGVDDDFVSLNDRLWGAGNWIQCFECPADSKGNQPYHHRNAHGVRPSVFVVPFSYRVWCEECWQYVRVVPMPLDTAETLAARHNEIHTSISKGEQW